jgi:hypothetical protein
LTILLDIEHELHEPDVKEGAGEGREGGSRNGGRPREVVRLDIVNS